MHINPPSELAVRIARHVVTHPERYLHIPATDRETMYRRNWATLLTNAAARRAKGLALHLAHPHSGDAA